MNQALLALLAAITLSACTDEGAAKDAVKGLLNDPESARFSQLNSGKEKGDVCGLVNAKNRMGGYVGDTPFFFQKSTQNTALVKPLEDSDFRSLWLGLNAGSVGDDLAKISSQCRQVSQWGAVCKTEYPYRQHSMCQVVLHADGKRLYEMLKADYDR